MATAANCRRGGGSQASLSLKWLEGAERTSFVDPHRRSHRNDAEQVLCLFVAHRDATVRPVDHRDVRAWAVAVDTDSAAERSTRRWCAPSGAGDKEGSPLVGGDQAVLVAAVRVADVRITDPEKAVEAGGLVLLGDEVLSDRSPLVALLLLGSFRAQSEGNFELPQKLAAGTELHSPLALPDFDDEIGFVGSLDAARERYGGDQRKCQSGDTPRRYSNESHDRPVSCTRAALPASVKSCIDPEMSPAGNDDRKIHPTPPDVRSDMVASVKRFVEREVEPQASEFEHRNEYPHSMVATMKELGLFGATIPAAWGGLGLDTLTYAMIVEEICVGWMSLSGILNTHLLLAYIIRNFGTDEQRDAYLPAMAKGELRGALCLSEAHAGSDVQAIRTVGVRDGDDYVINGAKMWVTNGRNGNLYALVVKTDPSAEPPHRGMSLFIAPTGPGVTVSRDIGKLGYKGVDTCEVAFEDYRVPGANLLGGEEGRGMQHVLSGLEVGRINIAARAIGVARAAFERAIRYSQERQTFGKPICEHQAVQLKLADMATKIEAARLLTHRAANQKDRGERCDLEAGMAKLFASETCAEVTLEAMRVHGGYGYSTEFPIERYYRDAPLMLIGEGTNEIQRTIIAKQLVKKYPA